MQCAVAALVLALAAQEAHAEPSPVERETARTLLLAGREKRKNGRVAEALADFTKAHAIMRVPTTGLDLGKAQADLGMLVEARATLLEVARFPEKPGEPQAFARARSEARQRADELAPRLATLTIAVPEGTRLTIDGNELAASSTGVPFKVNPGKHEVVATRGAEEKRAAVELAEGATESIALAFPPVNEPPRAATQVAPAPAPPAARPEQPETTTSALVWIGLGVAVTGAAIGTTTGLLAFRAKDDVASQCDAGVRCPPSTYDDIDRGETFGTISTIAFVAAGAGAAIMVYGLLNPTRVTPPQSTTGPALRGLSPFGLNGTF